MMSVKPAAILGAVAGIGLSVGLAGCHATQSHVTWRPDGLPRHVQPYQDWWNYQFVYHDEAQVYYEPFTATYYWFANGQWEQGSAMPEYMALWPEKACVVKLQQDKPYVQHATVARWHWPHDHAWPESTDEYHRTPEAIAASEQRAIDRSYGFKQVQGQQQGQPAGNTSDMATTNVSQPDSNTSTNESGQQPDDFVSGVDDSTSSSPD